MNDIMLLWVTQFGYKLTTNSWVAYLFFVALVIDHPLSNQESKNVMPKVTIELEDQVSDTKLAFTIAARVDPQGYDDDASASPATCVGAVLTQIAKTGIPKSLLPLFMIPASANSEKAEGISPVTLFDVLDDLGFLNEIEPLVAEYVRVWGIDPIWGPHSDDDDPLIH